MTPETLGQIEQIVLALIALVGAITALVQRLKRGQAERERDEGSKLWQVRHQEALSNPPTTNHEAQARAAQHAEEIKAEARRRATTRIPGGER